MDERPRIDGWKSIAAYVGRGVRTAQRWERELGLPVHRLNTGGAEVVFAKPDEVDAWLQRQSRSSLASSPADTTAETTGDAGALPQAVTAAPASRRRWLWPSAALLVVTAAAAGGWYLVPSGPSVNPTQAVGGGNTLTALDAKGEVAWTVAFETPLSEAKSPTVLSRMIHIADLDGDGINEVVFARADSADPTLYVLEDGRVRTRYRITHSKRFGQTSFGPPWQPDRVFLAPNGRTIVVGFHVLNDFAAVAQEMDVDGRVRGEYWSNGYITWFSRTASPGTPLSFIGAINNELDGASLAICEGPIRGSAPAVNEKYRFSDTRGGTPGVFLVFPRSRFQASAGIGNPIVDVQPVSTDTFIVRVSLGPPPGSDAPVPSAYYKIDRTGLILEAYLGEDVFAIHDSLVKDGTTTAATVFREEDLWPVRRWNGRGFDTITGPETAPPTR